MYYFEYDFHDVGHDANQTHNPVVCDITLIGGKYKANILFHLIDAILRFNELQKLIPQAMPKKLTQLLRELEGDGLIPRKVYPVAPPKTEYSLTEFGGSITPIINAMRDWGKDYIVSLETI